MPLGLIKARIMATCAISEIVFLVLISLISDPLTFVAASWAILLIGISKGGFAGSTGVLGTPFLALVMSPTQAVAVLLPVLCIMDVFALRAYRHQWDTRLIRPLLPAAILGIALGYCVFQFAPTANLAPWMGGCIVGIAVIMLLRELQIIGTSAAPTSTLRGWLWCSVSGFTSFIMHAGGPPANAYFMTLGLGKTQFQASTVLFFAALNFAKIPPYLHLQTFNKETLTTSAMLAVIAPFGIALGRFLHNRVGERIFRWIVITGLFATGYKLGAAAFIVQS